MTASRSGLSVTLLSDRWQRLFATSVRDLMPESNCIVFDLPPFDTGRYEDSEFLMSGGNALLTIRVAGMPPIKISFARVRWHEFTALYNCSREQIEGAYFKVAEIPHSRSLARYIANDSAGNRAYQELHHYRIFIDETGCHELYAERCVAL
jgi:hypothetical protein